MLHYLKDHMQYTIAIKSHRKLYKCWEAKCSNGLHTQLIPLVYEYNYTGLLNMADISMLLACSRSLSFDRGQLNYHQVRKSVRKIGLGEKWSYLGVCGHSYS